MEGVRVTGLYVYPLKSCGGIPLEWAKASWGGLLHDRRWMFVTADGRFMTQREFPQLCLVRTSFSETHLRIHAKSSEFWTPLWEHEGHGEEREVEAHGEKVLVYDEGKTAARWSSYVLDVECRLTRASWHCRWPDQQQYHVVSEASLVDLNGRMEMPLSMDRFRPNIVVTGCEPYAEDAWTEIRIGGVHFLGANRHVVFGRYFNAMNGGSLYVGDAVEIVR